MVASTQKTLEASIFLYYMFFLELKHFEYSNQHLRIFGNREEAVVVLQSRKIPDLFHTNFLRISTFSLFSFFLQLEHF
jgi:hypothetical protein